MASEREDVVQAQTVSTASGVDASPRVSQSSRESKVPMGNYQKLSEFMATTPTMSIFRRFAALNTQNVLFLQAELATLEGKF